MALRLTLIVLALATAGCRGEKARDRVVVLAAASLREAFDGIAQDFRLRHPQADVAQSFGGSQELRVQLEQGARADVVATADAAQMDQLVKQGLVEPPVELARNELALAVRPGSPVADFASLPLAERVVVGIESSPVGAYTVKLLDNAEATLGAEFRRTVERHIVSKELNVRQVLAKVELGEADAAVVYRTDVQPNGKVLRLGIPEALNVEARYQIAVVRGAPQGALAMSFVAIATGTAGQNQLISRGFKGAAPAQ